MFSSPLHSDEFVLVEHDRALVCRVDLERIRRGTFASVADLIKAVNEYIRIHNREPKPFVWVKKVDQILSKIAHCKPVIETLH